MRASTELATLIVLALLTACSAGEDGADLPPIDAGTWTWVSGSKAQGQTAVYGTKGIADPHNIPGARYSAFLWNDLSGKLWLFGGVAHDSTGFVGYFNDLWMFDPASGLWTWESGSNTCEQPGIYGIQGLAAPSNVPGARHDGVSWVDSAGHLWLFGGLGYDSAGFQGCLNDLWMFDPTARLWTWVSGSEERGQPGVYGTQGLAALLNVPGARWGAISWIDFADNLWLQGGADNVGLYFNDLWKYNPRTLLWTWISGSDTKNQAGSYGTKGVAASSNIPGAREGAVSWIDPRGVLWLFGGYGMDSAGRNGDLNDLWMYDPSTLLWTWISGGYVRRQLGDYGTRGVAAPSNRPGARERAAAWTGLDGGLYVFGGLEGPDPSGDYFLLNDVWRYDRATDRWIWVSGSNEFNQNGHYGTQGLGHPMNVPGARQMASSSVDVNGSVWLFGGHGYDAATWPGYLNDLWRYDR